MTCVVGWIEDGDVLMGADSAAASGWFMTLRADQKVFHNGPMLLGFTSSFRMGDLLRYSLNVPGQPEGMTDERYMATVFIDAVRACLKEGGFASKTNETESAGTFLVGYKGKLFEIDGDYQVGIPLAGFAAVGCGREVALGAMHASAHLRGHDRILAALAAAECFSAGVRAPFHVETLGSGT